MKTVPKVDQIDISVYFLIIMDISILPFHL